MSKLTNKQKRFIEEYLIDLNATKASIRAGYSEKTAYSIGNENLSKPEIQEAIQEAQKALADKAGFNQQRAREMYLDAFEKAKEQGQPSAMNQATSGLCKLYGLNEPDKKDITMNGAMPITHIESVYVEP